MESTTILLLDRWKKAKGYTADNQAAKALGIARATISSYRKGRSHADVEIAAKMAQDLGMEVIEILAAIEADRAIRPGAQAIWRTYGKGAFMALLLVGVALPGSGLRGLQAASGVPNQGVQVNEQSHYAT